MVSTPVSNSGITSSSLVESKMQQVNSIGYRLGSSTSWQYSNFEKNNQVINLKLQSRLRKELSKRGSFLINSYYYYHRNVVFCPIIYYRYHQRSRLQS